MFVLAASLTTGTRAAALPSAPSVTASSAADAPDGTSSACTSRPPFKAVIVVGPVGGQTDRYKRWADQIAAAARDAGMAVCKVYTPYADDETVKVAARGADLFVALMHGSGFPKPLRPADPDDTDGTANPSALMPTS